MAEGVETVYQLEVLNQLECDKAQGFLISRPVPADAMRSTMVALDEMASLSMFGAPDDAAVAPATPVGSRPTVDADTNGHDHSSPVVVGSISTRPLGLPVL